MYIIVAAWNVLNNLAAGALALWSPLWPLAVQVGLGCH